MIKTAIFFVLRLIAGLNTAKIQIISDAIWDQEVASEYVPEDIKAAWSIITLRYPDLKGTSLSNVIKAQKAVAVVRTQVQGARGNVLHTVVELVLYLVRMVKP